MAHRRENSSGDNAFEAAFECFSGFPMPTWDDHEDGNESIMRPPLWSGYSPWPSLRWSPIPDQYSGTSLDWAMPASVSAVPASAPEYARGLPGSALVAFLDHSKHSGAPIRNGTLPCEGCAPTGSTPRTRAHSCPPWSRRWARSLIKGHSYVPRRTRRQCPSG